MIADFAHAVVNVVVGVRNEFVVGGAEVVGYYGAGRANGDTPAGVGGGSFGGR